MNETGIRGLCFIAGMVVGWIQLVIGVEIVRWLA